jgi:hypothetical protein
MIAHRVGGWLAVILNVLIPAAGCAQVLQPMGGLVISGWAGGAASTSFQSVRALAEWQRANGSAGQQLFSRRLGVEPAMTVGLGLAYWFNEHWGLRIQAGVSRSPLAIMVSQRELSVMPGDSGVTGPRSYGSVRILAADSELLVRLPFTPRNRVAPYGFVGVSRLHYRVSRSEGLPPEATAFHFDDQVARFGGIAGAGAVVPLQRASLALNFEFSSSFARSPVGRAEPQRLQGERITVTTPVSGKGAPLIAQLRLVFGLAWNHR